MYHFVVHLKHCKSTRFQFKKLKIKKGLRNKYNYTKCEKNDAMENY